VIIFGEVATSPKAQLLAFKILTLFFLPEKIRDSLKDSNRSFLPGGLPVKYD